MNEDTLHNIILLYADRISQIEEYHEGMNSHLNFFVDELNFNLTRNDALGGKTITISEGPFTKDKEYFISTKLYTKIYGIVMSVKNEYLTKPSIEEALKECGIFFLKGLHE